jgi:phosphatidylserine/phosphatidylglycerophosphate/cardiolipin synthase-like enzyme
LPAGINYYLLLFTMVTKLTVLVIVFLIITATLPACVQFPSNRGSSLNPTTSIYFSQEKTDPASVLIDLYQNAASTIDIAIYSITHPDIISGIINASKRGIKIRLITDREQSASSPQKQALNNLAAAGIPIKMNNGQGLMHLKMSIIDKSIIILGSYNYTQTASKYNDEVLSVLNNPAIAADCVIRFEQMWNDEKYYLIYKEK